MLKEIVRDIRTAQGLTKVKRSFACLFTVLIVSSVLVTAYHFHTASGTNACAICKSADDFSAGGRQSPPCLTPLQIVVINAIAEKKDLLYSVVVALRRDRAPPLNLVPLAEFPKS